MISGGVAGGGMHEMKAWRRRLKASAS